jgi:pyruvate dehydrogenase E2 component (dihydrolipoamide acetyltransferase)
MEEGTIVKWKKNAGDSIKAGDILFEVTTDKATVEHSALDDGFLRKILIQEGQSAYVNQPVAVMSITKDEDISSYVVESFVPELKEKEVSLAPVQDQIEESAPGIKTSSVSLQQPAFFPEPPLEGYRFPFPLEERNGRVKASPYAKKVAQEKGIDLSTVKGSGPHGRILAQDVSMGQPNTAACFGKREVPQYSSGFYEEEPLSPMRKVIAQRLQQAKTWIPHFYVSQEIQADGICLLREQLKAGGIKVTFNDFVVKATALALKEHPEVNSGFNSVTQSIVRFKTIDISIAVSVPAGLITPIVRFADLKNLGQISVEVRSLAEKAKLGQLKREEYVGGSFTISNLGMYGISEFRGIINPPQAAILCIGGILEKPVIREGSVVPGKVMTCTVSADHRVIDGADAAKFLRTLQRFLENPALLLL